MTTLLIVLTGIAMVAGMCGSRLVAVSARIALTPSAVRRMQTVLAIVTIALTAIALWSVHRALHITVVTAPLAVLISGLVLTSHGDDDTTDGLELRLKPHLPPGSDVHAVAKVHSGWVALQNLVWITALIGPASMLGLGEGLT